MGYLFSRKKQIVMNTNEKHTVIISKPCSAKWENMQIEGDGRYCDLCNKVVVDFTQMTNTEIGKYFITHTAQKTCGYFNNGQVVTANNGFHQKLLTVYCKAYTIKHSAFRFTALTLISFLLTITGCKNHNDEHHTIGDTTFIDSAKVNSLGLDSINEKQNVDSLNASSIKQKHYN